MIVQKYPEYCTGTLVPDSFLAKKIKFKGASLFHVKDSKLEIFLTSLFWHSERTDSAAHALHLNCLYNISDIVLIIL